MANPSSEQRQAPKWLAPTTEYGPLGVFFVAYLMGDLFVATAAVMIATVVALVFSYAVARTFPKLPLVMAPVLLVLGGLTLYLEDDTFIKIRPTIVNSLLALVMVGSVYLGKQPLRFLMNSALNLNEEGWTKLTFRFGCLFAFLAVMNEIIWRTQTDDFWVTYKVFGALGITMVFMMTQIPMISRHTIQETKQPDED